MNFKYLLFSLLFVNLSYGASITVEPFQVEFELEKGAYEVDFKLTMACRYEKFVIGDSSEYEYIYEEVPLDIKTRTLDEKTEMVTLTNKSKRVLKLDGWFKSGKECQTLQNFFLKSKLYSIGWANQYNRPIRLGLFEHSRLEEFKVYDVQGLKDLIDNKSLGFTYKPSFNQVNIRFAIDGIPLSDMSTYLRTSAYMNPGTQMPWPLR